MTLLLKAHYYLFILINNTVMWCNVTLKRFMDIMYECNECIDSAILRDSTLAHAQCPILVGFWHAT